MFEGCQAEIISGQSGQEQGFFFSVNILMCFKVDKQREELVAVRTRVTRLFPCVNILMCFKVAKLREELLTVRTRVRISPVWIFLCVLRVPG